MLIQEVGGAVSREGYWTQDVTFITRAGGPLTTTTYYPPGHPPLFGRPSDSPRQASVLAPGFLEHRNHPTVSAVAIQSAVEGLPTTVIDHRDMYVNPASEPCLPRNVAEDMADIAHSVAPTDRLVLGGTSMGGVAALRAALLLAECSKPLKTVRATHVALIKSAPTAIDHAPFSRFHARAKQTKPFYPRNGQNERSGAVRIHEDVFNDHESNGDVRLLLQHLYGIEAPPPSVLIAPSPDDHEIDMQRFNPLKEEFPQVAFENTAGRHSDYEPHTAQLTARTVTAWLMYSSDVRLLTPV